MANSVEVRVPFLDKKFLDVAMLIAPKLRRPGKEKDSHIEKWILRKAFDVPVSFINLWIKHLLILGRPIHS